MDILFPFWDVGGDLAWIPIHVPDHVIPSVFPSPVLLCQQFSAPPSPFQKKKHIHNVNINHSTTNINQKIANSLLIQSYSVCLVIFQFTIKKTILVFPFILLPFLVGLLLFCPAAARVTVCPAPVPSLSSGASGGLAGPPSHPNKTQQAPVDESLHKLTTMLH